ncbi:MAG: methionine--tRNA ligase [Alphaproteobacteria bacterium]|nr:methionine--tRNA ligase [Alphaproteobacteria bacterium]
MTKQPFYITTAISYVNAPPHIGHAYEVIGADVMARFKRLDGFDVYFLTGTDEHGQKVQKMAQSKDKTPQAFCDEIAATFQDMADYLNISNDQFIRTTQESHKETSRSVWEKLTAAGDIYLNKYAGWYSVRDEAYYGEDEMTTREDGKKICTATGTEVEWIEEESYFFKLSAYEQKLLDLYESQPDFIQPSFRRNEVTSFVKQGLKDLSISRTSFDWGIKVPGDEKHVMYVWVDALINYISALGYPADKDGLMKKYWPCDVHLIGKDIVRFHAVYWPAILMSLGLPLPKRVFGHGFLLTGGNKMSKSVGNVISPRALVDKFGADSSRYALMREVTFGQDGDISWPLMTARINAELANNIGNLVQRTLSQINKNCDGKVPQPGILEDVDHALLTHTGQEMLINVRGEFEKLQFSRALEEIVRAANAANAYIDEQAPWTLKKTDPARMQTVLYVLAETIRNLGLILQPFVPVAAYKILDQVGVAPDQRDFVYIGAQHALQPATPLPKPEGVFPRIVEEEAEAAQEKTA